MDISTSDNETHDASGYIIDPLTVPSAEFSEFSVIHTSERNLVLKAKRHGRWWALKCVNPEAKAPVLEAALRKEFEIGLALPRGCSASMYDMECLSGYGPCIVMDFVEGPTLEQWLLTPHPRRECESVALAIVDTVGKIHKAGVVHRDIKPSNILLPAIGPEAVIIDFGLADTTLHSDFKQPAGTPDYMAPEQATSTSPDIRNDIYSLGAVLRKMHLPLSWRPAIREALKTIDSRPADTSALLRIRRKARALGRIISSLLCSAAIITAVILIFHSSKPAQTLIADTSMNAKADSLSNALDSLRASSRAEITALSSSLKFVNDSINAARENDLKHNEEILAAIRQEEAVIDRIWSETGLRYLDTVNRAGFIPSIFDPAPMTDEQKRFLDSVEDKYSQSELATISNALDKKIRTNIEIWQKRRATIKSIY